jgi:hypothetical protein
LFHQQAHRKVDVQRADLIVPEVMNDEVRDQDGPAGSGKSGKPTDMGACEVRLDGRLLELGPRVKRAFVQIPDQLTSRLVPDSTLVTGVRALAGRRAGSLTPQGARANAGVGYRPVPMRPRVVDFD